SFGGIVINCTKCPDGFYSTSWGSSSCTICGIGQECVDPIQSPKTCPAGTFSPSITSPCIACPIGMYSLGGATACTACPSGHQCPNPSELPEPCPFGYFSGMNKTKCEKCLP